MRTRAGRVGGEGANVRTVGEGERNKNEGVKKTPKRNGAVESFSRMRTRVGV